jgi:hypothetical protein
VSTVLNALLGIPLELALRRCGSPEEAEAKACLEGLHLTAEWSKQPTQVESDCLMLIREVQRKDHTRTRMEGLL